MSVVGPAASTPWLRAGAYALLAGVAIAVPLVLAEVRPAFVSMSYGLSFLPYELLGLTGGVAILAAGVFELRRRRAGDVASRVAVLVPCLLALHFVTLTSEYAQRRFDYDCYEYAGRAILAGESPYRAGLIYLYPPLTAQLFATAHRGVATVSEGLGAESGRDAVWDRVFYLYQCAQVLLLLGAYFLLLRFGRELGLAWRWAPLLIGGLLVFDNAVFRTLRHGQVNLWVLDLSLIGLLWARHRPALAGVAIALAGHVKLYPLLLLFPLSLCGRGAAAAWTLGAAAGISVLGSDLARDWTLWSQYAALVGSGFPGEVAFRNNGLHSMAFNTARLVFGASGAEAPVRWFVRLATLAFGVWALVRFAQRERARRRGGALGLDARCFAAHGADALAFALLASPSVWEHHYVMALPLALVACVARGADRPGLVALGLFLMLAMPTFDLFPFGYHRFAGMLVLLAASSPRGEPAWLVGPQDLGAAGSLEAPSAAPSGAAGSARRER
jgi:hypothetical protein